MKRIISWWRAILLKSSSDDVQPDRSSPQSGQTDLGVKLPKELEDLLDDTSVSNHPALHIQMPDIYADGIDVTVPDLRVLDDSSQDGDDAVGFDPYDTAVFHKK